MSRLLFKNWLNEMADYGFDQDPRGKPQGGTEEIDGSLPFIGLDGAKIITELAKLPALGANYPFQRWNDIVEWGRSPGAIQAVVTPLGAMRIVVRRLITDLYGEQTWICIKIVPLNETEIGKEISIANKIYDQITEMSQEMIPNAESEYEDLERLTWKLWVAAKRNHPSYCMFPTTLKKQNENYFKLVFEFRGHGVQTVGGNGRAEQFDIDIYYDKKKGLIKCTGYNIESTMRTHSWMVQPSEFNEYFSPKQNQEEIIKCIIEMFMQY